MVELGRGNAAAAADLFRQILAARQRTLGEHPMIGGSLYSLGRALEAQGDRDGAVERFQQAIAMYRKTLPTGHIDLARPLFALGRLYAAELSVDLAEPSLAEAHTIRSAVLPPTHPSRVVTAQAYGRCLLNAKKHREAATVLQELWDAVRPTDGLPPQLRADIREDLADCYDALGETDRGAQVRDGG